MLAVFVGARGVLLRFLVLPVAVVMGRLQVVMSGGVMMSGRLVVMLDCWVLLGHGAIPRLGEMRGPGHDRSRND
jgi:hypothetical protein